METWQVTLSSSVGFLATEGTENTEGGGTPDSVNTSELDSRKASTAICP